MLGLGYKQAMEKGQHQYDWFLHKIREKKDAQTEKSIDVNLAIE